MKTDLYVITLETDRDTIEGFITTPYKVEIEKGITRDKFLSGDEEWKHAIRIGDTVLELYCNDAHIKKLNAYEDKT